MTGDDWARCSDPVLMVEYLRSRGRLSDRKERLLACHLLRRFEDRLPDVAVDAVALAERYADGRATADELTAAATEVWTRLAEDEDRSWGDDNIKSAHGLRICRETPMQDLDGHPLANDRMHGGVDGPESTRAHASIDSVVTDGLSGRKLGLTVIFEPTVARWNLVKARPRHGD